MSSEPTDRDPFEPAADPWLRERAQAWMAEEGHHLPEGEISRLAESAGWALEHVLQCEECAMRASTRLAHEAKREEPRAANPSSRRWLLAAAAVLALVFLPQVLRGPRQRPAVEASLLHDPAALRGQGGLPEIRISQLDDGTLSVLLSVETSAQEVRWSVQRPDSEASSGVLSFPPETPHYKEFVLRLRLLELLDERSGDLELSARDPQGALLGRWPLRVKS